MGKASILKSFTPSLKGEVADGYWNFFVKFIYILYI